MPPKSSNTLVSIIYWTQLNVGLLSAAFPLQSFLNCIFELFYPQYFVHSFKNANVVKKPLMCNTVPYWEMVFWFPWGYFLLCSNLIGRWLSLKIVDRPHDPVDIIKTLNYKNAQISAAQPRIWATLCNKHNKYMRQYFIGTPIVYTILHYVKHSQCVLNSAWQSQRYTFAAK